jgi:hypothetical protein
MKKMMQHMLQQLSPQMKQEIFQGLAVLVGTERAAGFLVTLFPGEVLAQAYAVR